MGLNVKCQPNFQAYSNNNIPNFYLYQQRFVALKMRWRPGLRPELHWRSSRRCPRPPSRLGKGTPPPLTSPLATRCSFFQPEPYHFLKRSGAHGTARTYGHRLNNSQLLQPNRRRIISEVTVNMPYRFAVACAIISSLYMHVGKT